MIESRIPPLDHFHPDSFATTRRFFVKINDWIFQGCFVAECSVRCGNREKLLGSRIVTKYLPIIVYFVLMVSINIILVQIKQRKLIAVKKALLVVVNYK